MKNLVKIFSIVLLSLCTSCNAQDYEVYAKFEGVRPANPAVAKDGTVYVTMHPLDGADVSLMKVSPEGKHTAYPNKKWASNPVKGIGTANAIGIQATEEDLLYVLDFGNATNPARLVVWNLKNDALHRIYNIPSTVAHKTSFMQDFAIDTERQMVYIADMTRSDLIGEQAPAIVIINLKTGETKRVLENDPTFLPSNTGLPVDGKLLNVNGAQVNLGLNPIVISPDNKWLYYSTMTEGFVYRIKSETLADFSKSDEDLKKSIEKYGPKPASDGMSIDGAGNVYITDVSANGVGVTTKDNYKLLFSSPKVSWMDGMAYGGDGYFYGIVNELHKAAPFNNGTEKGSGKYKIIKFKALAAGKIGR